MEIEKMLADTLMLDISKATNARRERSKQLGLLAEQAAQLETLPSALASQLAPEFLRGIAAAGHGGRSACASSF